jgi:RHS repeat-associated protein
MSVFGKFLSFVLKVTDTLQRSVPTRWLGRHHQRLLPVFAVLMLLAGGLTAVVVHEVTVRSVPVTIAAFHVMPRPAYRTAIGVHFSEAPNQASRRPSLADGRSRLAAPFRQCPRIGADAGCADLIDVTNTGHPVIADHAQGPYDGSAATLIGVQNSSSGWVSALSISTNTDAFGFDGGGICDGRYTWSRHCPFGSTGYEGPGVSFSDIGPRARSGVVNFNPPLAPGMSAYFSLAQALAAGAIAGGAPSVAEQGGAANSPERQAACSAEPVNCATGSLVEQYTDFSLPGLGVPVVLTRTYTSGRATINSPFGHGWTFSYGMKLTFGADGQVSVLQENGATVTFRPNGLGGYAAPSRVMATLTGGPRVGYTFTRLVDQVRFHFRPSGQLSAELDPNGYATTLSHRRNSLIVTGASGRALTFTFAGGYVRSVTDPTGHRETYSYDSAGDLRTVTDPAGRTWRFSYRDYLLTAVELTSKYRQDGRLTTAVRYDAAGRVSSVTATDQGTTTWTYHGRPASPEGGITTVTEPGHDLSVYDYSGLELTAVTFGAYSQVEATTGYTYNPSALVTTATDPDLHTTEYGYDQGGYITTVVNPVGARTSYRYNRYGEVTWAKLPDEPPTRTAYAADGAPALSRDPLGELTTYYLRHGHPAEIAAVLNLAGRVGYGYDPQGDVTRMSEFPSKGITNTTSYGYNADGEVVCQAAPTAVKVHITCPGPGAPRRPGTTTYGYNADGQLTSVTGPAGYTTTYSYDLNGNISEITEPNRPEPTVVDYGYNALNEQTSVRRNGVLIATATYNQLGDQLTQSDAGQVTHYAYDQLGYVTKITDPLGQVTRYSYDHAGNKILMISPSGQRTRYGYNADGELMSVNYGSARRAALSYSYYGSGMQHTAADSAGLAIYSYDADQRLVLDTFRASDGYFSSYRYSYDDPARTVTLTYPNHDQVVSQYDGAGRLTSVTDWLHNTIRFGYNADGDVDREKLPGGITTSYTATGIKVARFHVTMAAISSTSDPAGRLASTAATGPTGVAASHVSYTYTPAGQLASAGGQSYRYTTAGGLERLPGGVTQRFNSDDELTSTDRLGVATQYHYNADGELRSETQGRARTLTLAYDQADQLTSYRTKGNVVTYGYDGYGLRVSSTSNGSLTRYTWDQAQSTPLLLSDGSTYYVYGPNGQPVEQISGRTPTYLIADPQGSTRLLTSESGKITGAYQYDSYGTATHSMQATTALQYDGQLTDAQTGYIYLRARYYDPTTGQFLTRDPATQLTGAPYTFAGNDPVNATDPSGLSFNPLSWLGGVFSTITSAASSIVSAAISGIATTISAVASLAGQAITSGAQLAATAAGYLWHVTIGEHWRGLLEAAVGLGAFAGALLCIAATAGLCGIELAIAGVDVAIGEIAVNAAIAGLRDGLNYLIGAGPKSVGGFFSTAGWGSLNEVTNDVLADATGIVLDGGVSNAPLPPSPPDIAAAPAEG